MATSFVRKGMEKIFSQEELYWLDDILPGMNGGRIRRTSISRNVRLPKVTTDETKRLNDAPDQSATPLIVVNERSNVTDENQVKK